MMEKNREPLSSILHKNGVLSKRKSPSESDDDLSDISDAEIIGYLNNKTEMLFKKLVWEAMNKDYPKKQRTPATGKKSSAKKAVASRTEKEKEKEMETEKKKRLSSKINYDALEKLTDEPDEVSEKAKEGGIHLNSGKQIEKQHGEGTSNLEVCGFEDNYSDEFEPENTNLYSYENEEEEYGYWEDYEYEEF